jgi:hypothetical protein
MNDLDRVRRVFEPFELWTGEIAAGWEPDFLGNRTDLSLLVDPPPGMTEFPEPKPARTETVAPPAVADGEFFFEAADALAAVQTARERFTMIELGGGYGPRLVIAQTMLERLNPMPSRLVLVEPEATLIASARAHFRNNGIDPDGHWFLRACVTPDGDPTLIFTGRGRTSLSRMQPEAARELAATLAENNIAEAALANLLAHMKMGLPMAGGSTDNDIAAVNGVLLADLLAPLDRVDLLDIDIQGDEAVVLPAAIGALAQKVKRIHIGTHNVPRHGPGLHANMVNLFRDAGWEIVFSFDPNTEHQTALGPFRCHSDGIVSTVNPALL